MTIKDMVADGIARSNFLASEAFESIEGIQQDCTACESTVTGMKPTLVDLNRKIQQHSNTLTQHKMTQRNQMCSHAIRSYGKETFAVHRVDNSCGKLKQRPCQQYEYQKSVRKTFPK